MKDIHKKRLQKDFNMRLIYVIINCVKNKRLKNKRIIFHACCLYK